MKRIYVVEGLTFATEKAAIEEASKVARTRKSDGDYALILLEQDYGWCVPHSRVYKNGRLEKVSEKKAGQGMTGEMTRTRENEQRGDINMMSVKVTGAES